MRNETQFMVQSNLALRKGLDTVESLSVEVRGSKVAYVTVLVAN